MLIAGFGDTYATAAIFPTNMPEDDWTVQRPAAQRRIPFAGGAFDYRGDDAPPVAAYTVRKKFMLLGPVVWKTGTGLIFTEFGGVPLIEGDFTDFLNEVEAGNVLRFTMGGTQRIVTVLSVSNEAEAVISQADYNALLPYWGTEVPYEIGNIDCYTNLDAALETLKRSVLGVGESKLWLEMRDGSHRWAWAKCQKVRQIERVEDRLAVPVELEFYLREGVWYSETLHSGLVSGTSGNATLANAGNIATAVKATVHAGSANITAASVGGKWAFSGTLLAGNDLIVDAARPGML